MKRKFIVGAVIAVCLSLLGYGTLAYFTAEGTAHNVITTGGVEIALNEWADEDKTVPFEDVSGIMPGAELTKIVEVTNTGASPAWVRIKVEKAIELANEIAGFAPNTALVELNIDTANWAEKDGYYYYKEALLPTKTTAPLFTAVTFKIEMGNEYQGATATVDVLAQAVQVANNGTSALDAAGWPPIS